MGPVNRCSWTATDAWLCPHYFNGWLGRETGWESVNLSANGLGIISGAISFSGAVALLDSIGAYTKGCHVWLVMSTYMSFVSDFSCMMYNDSNHRDSQI
jgi:hypothetical protein